MSVLVYGICIFLFAFFLHLVIWKIRVPKKNQTIVLLEIFFTVLVLSIFMAKAFSQSNFFGVAWPQTLYEYLAFVLLYASLTFGYIASYSAIEVDSPSLTMVLSIAKETKNGLDKEKFYSSLTDELLVIPRLKDLVSDKMVFVEKDKYQLTAKGNFLVNIFIRWRTLLNAGKGG